MGALLELFGSISTILFSFTKDVTEDEIEKNIVFLKDYQWFQKYLEDDQFNRLIKEDEDVRIVIGKMNREKMKKNTYHNKQLIKIEKILLKKGG